MDKKVVKNLIVSFSLVLIAVALCGALPAIVLGKAKFLGKDVSSVALGLMELYPHVAVVEALKVVFFVTSMVWLVFQVNAQAIKGIIKQPLIRSPLLVFLLVSAYGAFFSSAIIKYPALFEASLGISITQSFVKSLHPLSPSACLWLASLLSFSAPLGLLLNKIYRHPKEALIVFLPLFFLPLKMLPSSCGHTPIGARPNILLIAIDSLRFDKSMNHSIMPNLSQLKDDPQTVSFFHHHIGIPRTFPSWIEMLTGKYAAESGIRHMFPGFKERSRAFPGIVADAKKTGYITRVFSDFAGDIFPRFKAGFDEFYAPKLDIATMIRLGVDQASPVLMPFLIMLPVESIFPALSSSPSYSDAEKLTHRYFISQYNEDQTSRFDLIFYSSAHFPYAVPYPYYDLFKKLSYDGRFLFQKNPEEPLGPRREQDILQVQNLYNGGLKSIDDQLARIFEDLKVRGLWDKTLIIVTADHGENLYEHDLGQGHGEHLRGENVLKVPWLIKLPQTIKNNKREFENLTRSIDLAPTIAGLLDLKFSEYQGVDLSPWIRGLATSGFPRLTAYAETGIWFSGHGSEFFQKNRVEYPGIAGLLSFDPGKSGEIILDRKYEKLIVAAKHRMLIDGAMKLIFMPTQAGVRWELYNQKKDPHNLVELSESEPHLLRRMQAKFWGEIRAIERERALVIDDYVVPK